jgi:hypothetical protein
MAHKALALHQCDEIFKERVAFAIVEDGCNINQANVCTN